jgi:hypothetical protein
MNNAELIQKIKRVLAFICAICVGWAGMFLSNAGFNFNIRDFTWIGWSLAFAITITELVFNSQLTYKNTNFTIYVLGITAYLYDVGSNFAGIWMAQGYSAFNDIVNNIPSALFCFVASLFIAYLPETLMIYALVGIVAGGEGDFLKNLMGIRDTMQSNSNPQNNHSQQGNNQNPHQNGNQMPSGVPAGFMPVNPQRGQQSNKHKQPKQTRNPIYGGRT